MLDTLRVPWDVRPPGHPFLHPGRSARVFSGETELGWLGEVHPLVARAWDLDGTVAAFEIDLGLAIEQAPTEIPFTAVHDVPARAARPRGRRGPRTSRARRSSTSLRQAARPRRSRSSTSTATRSRMHLAFRAPDRTLTDDEVDERMAGDRRRRWPSSGSSSVPSAVVAGASGYAGALAARLLHEHPDFDLVAVTSRSDAGVRLDELYPYHRVPLTLDAFDADELGGVDAAIVAYPHGASAPTVAELHERGVKVVDLSADFRLRDPGTYAEWYGEHGAPSLFGHGVYGLPGALPRAGRRGAHVANPGCYPDRRRCSASRRSPAPG